MDEDSGASQGQEETKNNHSSEILQNHQNSTAPRVVKFGYKD